MGSFLFSVISPNETPKLNFSKTSLSTRWRFKVASERPARSNFLPITTHFSSTPFPWEILIEGRWYWVIMPGNLRYLITSESRPGLMAMLFLWAPNFVLKPSPAISLYCAQTILWRTWDKYSHIHPSDSRGGGGREGARPWHQTGCIHSCLYQLAAL